MDRQRSEPKAGDDHAADLLEVGGDASHPFVEFGFGAHHRHGAQCVGELVGLERDGSFTAQIREAETRLAEEPVARPAEEAEIFAEKPLV